MGDGKSISMLEKVGGFIGKVEAAYSSAVKPIHNLPSPVDYLVNEVYRRITHRDYCRLAPTNSVLEALEGEIGSSKITALAAFKKEIGRLITLGEPILLILGYGPYKNRKNCSYRGCDLAEELCFIQLWKLNLWVKEVYSPGIKVRIYMDNNRAQEANSVPQECIDDYLQTLRALTAEWPFCELVDQVKPLSELYEELGINEEVISKQRERAQEWAEKNSEKFESYRKSAERNLVFAEEDTEEKRLVIATDAAIEYLAYLWTEEDAGIWIYPLVVRYSRHEGFCWMFSLERGCLSLPWQGEGCVVITQKGSVKPFVYPHYSRDSIVVFVGFFSRPGRRSIKVYVEKA
jgi:hypothetical protein